MCIRDSLGYLVYGEGILSRLNGIFAAALWDEEKETLFLFRDRVGVKPLFYTRTKDSLVYASEIKGLLQYPGIKARVDGEGLCEIFALGPAKTYGKGVFQDVREVLPGHYLTFSHGVLQEHGYWKLESRCHEDSFEQTVEKDVYKRQEEYITQIAFSGATQFLEKYKDKTNEDQIIGHFRCV